MVVMCPRDYMYGQLDTFRLSFNTIYLYLIDVVADYTKMHRVSDGSTS